MDGHRRGAAGPPLARWLARHAAPLHLLLRLTGVLGRDETPRGGRDRLRWDALAGALAEPDAAIRQSTGWGGGFAAWPVQRDLGRALARLGAPVQLRPRSATVAEALAGAPVAQPAGTETGIVLASANSAEVGVVVAFEPMDGGTLLVANVATASSTSRCPSATAAGPSTASGELDGTATAGVRVTPSGLTLIGGEPTLEASLALEGAFSPPKILAGSATGTRLELDGARLELGVEGDLDDPEAYALVRVDEGRSASFSISERATRSCAT